MTIAEQNRQMSSIISLLLLCAFTKVALSNVGEPILDTQGQAVVAGAEYYMLVKYQAPDEGEFGPGKISNMTCPVSIVEDLANKGELLRLSSTLGKKGIIYINDDLEISFSKKIECAESSKWIIVKEKGEDFWSMGLGSARDHPGSEILSGSFKIQKYEFFNDYKFLFCPNTSVCGNIARIGYEPQRLNLYFGRDAAFDFILKSKISLAI